MTMLLQSELSILLDTVSPLGLLNDPSMIPSEMRRVNVHNREMLQSGTPSFVCLTSVPSARRLAQWIPKLPNPSCICVNWNVL